VTLSGWVVKLGSWWDDGHEQNFYTGDKDTTLSSHFQLSGSATIAPGWSGGYTIAVEAPGNAASVGFNENQFNDNCWKWNCGGLGGTGLGINTLLSYMWLKSDRWGTANWGQLSQATDNVALLPDLSGTVIEANAVLFDGGGMFVRPKGAKNSNDLATGDFKWSGVVNCLVDGGGLGADCNGYPNNGFRYDTPTWAGFSASGGYYEDDAWDIALKYAADWNSIKVSAAVGFTQLTDEGCLAPGNAGCTSVSVVGGGGTSFQGFRVDGDIFQVGASILHVPSGLFAYGMYQREENNGTQFKTVNFPKGNPLNTGNFNFRTADSDANETNVWYVKAGIKRAWMPAGATVLFGEWGRYEDQFNGLCGNPGGQDFGDSPIATGNATNQGNTFCLTNLPIGVNKNGTAKLATDPFFGSPGAEITGSEVDRWGLGVVQEIDSAAMHLFARWQHVSADIDAKDVRLTIQDPKSNFTCGDFANGAGCKANNKFGKSLGSSFEDLDIFQIGGVIFF
jgi:hypothetical protein